MTKHVDSLGVSWEFKKLEYYWTLRGILARLSKGMAEYVAHGIVYPKTIDLRGRKYD